ncbi:HD domain-containing protein [Streptomyces sp. NPDC013457]|uniref:HD domain-containing protein n=1 Tax=Streptomyces sp. NPDC013457 TaxID=3364866 RepID=UPI0036FACF9E
MNCPSVDEIRSLHRKHAPSAEAFELVFTHCEIVWKIARQLLPVADLTVDGDLVRAGSLLHDIGVYRLYDAEGRLDHRNYVRHGVLGHEILAEEGLPEALCRFCSCHTGVGLSRHDIREQGLPLPPGDYLAATHEERLVMYADKFHSKTTPPTFVRPHTYAAHLSRYGAHKVRVFDELRATFGDPILGPLSEAHRHALT